MPTNSTKEQINTAGNHSNSVDSTTITNCVLIGLLMPIAIVGNSLVLGAILRTTSLRSPSIIYICSLAISDLLVGVIVQPLYIASLLLTKFYYLKKLVEIAAYTTCGVSLCTLTAISVDRFMALHYHMRYTTLVSTSRAVYISVIIFCINLFAAVIYFWNRSAYLLVMASSICISFLISTFSYVAIYRTVRRHKAQIHAQQQAMQSANPAVNGNMIQLKRSAVNTFVFYIVSILCYLPVVFSLSIYSLSFKNWTKAWNFADTLVFMNSSINPFLFSWRLSELRRAVVEILRQLMLPCKTGDDNNNVISLS